jgi:hypothetical protein
MNENEFKNNINVAAYFIAQKNIPYDKLCWLLAERKLFVQRNFQNAPQEEIRNKAAELYHSGTPYDIMCWFIAELDILIKMKSTH